MDLNKGIYLDNAATTPLLPEVKEAMLPFLGPVFGNPSSTHSFGRQAKAALELARKEIAHLICANPGEIYFTSGGTEANNMALNLAIDNLEIKTLITSPIEHHSVLHTVEGLKDKVKLLTAAILSAITFTPLNQNIPSSKLFCEYCETEFYHK